MRAISTFFIAVLAASACDSASGPAAREPAPAPAPVPSPVVPALRRIDQPNLVCMVNNQFMGQPQIPVDVGGKIYFGCCVACRDRLLTDPSLRTARDPVSDAVVDKAVAVMARRADGSILYFESEETLRAYRP